MSTVADAETLKFLVNPAYQERVSADQRKVVTSDRRARYRKRILSLHQSLMKGETPECGLKAAHDAFVGAAIRYIRLEEERKLVQAELEKMESRDPPDCAQPGPEEYDVTAETVKALARPPPPPTIDNFVIRTSGGRPMHVPRKRRKRPKKSHGIVDGTAGGDATKVKKKKRRAEEPEGRSKAACQAGARRPEDS